MEISKTDEIILKHASDITREILLEISPEESSSTAIFFEAYRDQWHKIGKRLTIDDISFDNDTTLGFGGSELVALVVIPLVVSILSTTYKIFLEDFIAKYKRKEQQERELELIRREISNYLLEQCIEDEKKILLYYDKKIGKTLIETTYFLINERLDIFIIELMKT